MDHSQHQQDHGNMSMHDDSMHMAGHDNSCPMIMVFHGGHCETILFKGWVARTVTEFALSATAIFLFAVLYEALKFLRDFLMHRCLKKEAEKNALANRQPDQQQGKYPEASSEAGHCDRRPLAQLKKLHYKENLTKSAHIIQTLLNLVQVTIAYLLMLIAMTYNYWLLLAVVLGLAVGYFFFGCVRRNVTDNECCH